MRNYARLLESMMEAILTGNSINASALLRDKQEFPATKQLGVYIDAYRWRLAEALETAYPALRHYLEKPGFESLANGFITAHPSRHFNLDTYAIAFAGYVSDNTDDEFARELAALEGAIHDVYQREENPAIAADWAQHQTPATLAGATLSLRAASCLLAFNFPVDAYLTSFRTGEKPTSGAKKKNWLLVLRHRNRVNRLALAEGEYALLCLIEQKQTLAQALEDARLAPFLEREDFAALLPVWLSRWGNEGVLRSIS